MTDFDAIDALLAGARKEVPLPPVPERRALREELGLSRPQLAQALGVGPSTIAGWESGRDPSGEVREKYAYFLEGARTKLAADSTPPADEPTLPSTGSPTEAAPAPEAPAATTSGPGDGDELSAPQPCVLCGRPARHQVEGFPQHLDPAECGTDDAERTPPREESRPEPSVAPRPQKVVPAGRRLRTGEAPDPIAAAVAAALDQHSGDVEAATAALVRRAIPDAMALLDLTRKGGRYDIVAHPWLPDVLRKPTARGADEIWEARPKWTRPTLPPGEHQVTALDVNGAYLSALKTHLPIGRLEHSTGDQHDRRRAGVHLVTPPDWEHDAYLPNPLGNRDEPGPLWVTEPTLRLLQRLSGPRYGLCDPPVIHESWTSGATENLLEKFRVLLKDARDRAIAEGDEVTLEYVKAMYAKFVSTMGESNYNRELYRTDWMHLIRSQAFVNLWWKAHRAYDEGLMVVRAMGTDELHVIGDWRAVFPEGRAVTEVKVKDVYTVGEAVRPES
ncbi:helix-turn-helix transcriptional regulator [Streptomyces sp. KAU_LT]|uniref:helix-turn-helix domain-containing protein n=1 Tax=Streptomyces sp. KAU_LT TaxID=3046669 RepID=UPI0024B669D9|nr:helix-turn-helix transcriptional regulator [Streptomyces sp. KAU_LT]MDI9835496.1 helix-turn-helix transcriptional regulator [Streptomyces sp. KAU_LT]